MLPSSAIHLISLVVLTSVSLLLCAYVLSTPDSIPVRAMFGFGEGGSSRSRLGLPDVLVPEGVADSFDPNQHPGSSNTDALSGSASYKTSSNGQDSAVRLYMEDILRNGTASHEPDQGSTVSTQDAERYDPRRWERFEREDGYYLNSSVDQLRRKGSTRSYKPYKPYPSYNSNLWRRQWKGNFVPCYGARGSTLSESPDDQVFAHRGPPKGFPRPSVGSFEALSLDPDVCFDRYSRYGPYGLDDPEFAKERGGRKSVNWTSIDWNGLQTECHGRNRDRYFPHARGPSELNGTDIPDDFLRPEAEEETVRTPKLSVRKFHPRTAVLIRSWEGYAYSSNDIHTIRALITELSLASGGEYTVFLLVNITSPATDLYSDKAAYDAVLEEHVPPELRPIAILWTDGMSAHAYPTLVESEQKWGYWLPVQWFAATHPEFDFVWSWEPDTRYTGHHYHLLEQVAAFGRRQPRRQLWERSKRFHLPAVHGDYHAFIVDTDRKITEAAADGAIPAPVWGPPLSALGMPPRGPRPPNPADHQATATWGAGEEADLLTLLPIFDPRNTSWEHRNTLLNPVHAADATADPDPDPDHTFARVPRRASLSTAVVRLSRPLLAAMHAENRAGRAAHPALWPATVALQHGFKAAYAPHPLWLDRRWPRLYADVVFNAHSDADAYEGHDAPEAFFRQQQQPSTGGKKGPGRSGPTRENPRRRRSTGEARAKNPNSDRRVYFPALWTERRDSPYNPDRAANFAGWSWADRSAFPGTLYRRWLGRAVREGPVTGEEADSVEEETDDGSVRESDKVMGGPEWERKRGVMCLPGMLLHPVKDVADEERDGDG